ncbi:MAG: penicillin-binding transpeptidase domain-containing protein [Agathobacter sp.]|nr:penicillin-binding transpeptidase domain-containing protein [Agathobacter sp.]
MCAIVLLCLVGLMGRLVYLMIFQGEKYSKKASDLQYRERQLRGPRGRILDRNGLPLADNQTVCTVSVIHNQIEDSQRVAKLLARELDIDEDKILKKINKVTSIELIKSNVPIETGDRIRKENLKGIKVDVDYSRYYPFGELASKVIGFTGSDNQGIIGLEAIYDKYLKGQNGTIYSITDSRGVEVKNYPEKIQKTERGNDIQLSLDYNIQSYCTQAAELTYVKKQADGVSIIAMNPQNGEILAMVDYPEFDLTKPFELTANYTDVNQMWRNSCINDTYEPGSIFKIVTTAIALEENLVGLEDRFYCPGYIVVEDRRIRCHKTQGHGSQTFVEAIENSCNPVFIDIGQRIGIDRYCDYFRKFGLQKKTGIDLPGESKTIMHKKENMGQVELATVAFGQSFQITPIQLITTVSSLINGGYRVTPHLADKVINSSGKVCKTFEHPMEQQVCQKKTSETLRFLLEKVVSEGGGSKAYIEGFEIGGKTATSQTLPRSDNKYISAFLGFAPADNPRIIMLVKINNPKGQYYGGTIAAPVAKMIFENILPYVDKLDK